jgi:hypothetical protein
MQFTPQGGSNGMQQRASFSRSLLSQYGLWAGHADMSLLALRSGLQIGIYEYAP